MRERLTTNAEVATVLGLIPATSNLVESEGRQMKYQLKKVGVVLAHSIKSCIRQAVHQVVFTDVLIVGQLFDVEGHSFAPIGLHRTDAVSDLLLIKRHCICTKGLPEVQLQN